LYRLRFNTPVIDPKFYNFFNSDLLTNPSYNNAQPGHLAGLMLSIASHPMMILQVAMKAHEVVGLEEKQ
jgi:hypothetical protein